MSPVLTHSNPGINKTSFVLVYLSLERIPHSGYKSPEATVACRLALPRLKTFYVEFESPRSRLNRGSRHPPPTRFILPTLIKLHFSVSANIWRTSRPGSILLYSTVWK